ncbi:hypothetical protein NDU88_002325 [Pleurodeles waltl]|uniref:Uncharacterized protein n=1 Tax=Pleurodeles waltl TaxID=8319 RepID=A0AAV7U9L2_PLEWA|nr:hypothetical protein NDU88_002325 [Pleurodeles waltl]
MRNASLPATLQEKNGRLRCVLGPVSGNQGGWVGRRELETKEEQGGRTWEEREGNNVEEGEEGVHIGGKVQET